MSVTGGKVNEQELHAHLERGLENLRREFAGKVPAEHVTRIGRERFERMLENATITDFIPLLVHRQVREALLDLDAAAGSTTPRRIEVSTRALESVRG